MSIPQHVNVLIADDHPLYQQALSNTVRTITAIDKISCARNGDEALSLLQKSIYHLVLTDIRMPGMDGIKLVRHLHEHYPEVLTIIVSMIDDGNTIRQVYGEGCNGYVVKNADESEVVKAIRTVLAGKRYFNPDMLERIVDSNDEKLYEQFKKNYRLTPYDLKIIRMIYAGNSNSQIAHELNLSVRTVENRRNTIYHKASVNNTADLIRFAINNGLIEG